MRILYISYVNLFSTGGAPIEARKFYYSLKNMSQEIKNFDFKVISLDKNLEECLPNIELRYSKKSAMFSRLCGHSYYMFWFWRKNSAKIMSYKPDLVILGRSNLGFIARDIKLKAPNVKVITDVDNIEIDYIEAWCGKEKSIMRKLLISQLKKATYKDECDAICYSDWCFFLTKRNLMRAKDQYGYDSEKYSILPICIPEPKGKLYKKGKRSIAFYGTLDYCSNHNGITDFLNNVWTPYFSNDERIELIIAGKNPLPDLYSMVQKFNNVKLYAGFDTLEDILPRHAMALAPLKDGAGMKTKMAEALAYGMFAVGSSEAWVGYEEILNCSKGVQLADTPEEYREAIELYLSCSDEELQQIGQRNHMLYLQHYSLKTANLVIKNAIKMLEYR